MADQYLCARLAGSMAACLMRDREETFSREDVYALAEWIRLAAEEWFAPRLTDPSEALPSDENT